MVNLASRAVKLADPKTVLASAEVAGAADGHRFASIRAQQLKGFDELVELFELSRA